MPGSPVHVTTPAQIGAPFRNVQQDPPQTPAPWSGWISSRLARRPRQGFFHTTSVLFPPVLTPIVTFIAPEPVVALQAVNRSSVW